MLNEARIDLAVSGHTHKYGKVEAGQDENRFPILIGDPQNIIRVDATADGLNVVVRNADGSVKDELHLPEQGKPAP